MIPNSYISILRPAAGTVPEFVMSGLLLWFEVLSS